MFKIIKHGEKQLQIITTFLWMKQKKIIISIFFGKAPRSDIPYLWKLKDEVELIIDRVLQKDEYKELNNCFNDRPNPKYSRFAYVIAEIEDKMIR